MQEKLGKPNEVRWRRIGRVLRLAGEVVVLTALACPCLEYSPWQQWGSVLQLSGRHGSFIIFDREDGLEVTPNLSTVRDGKDELRFAFGHLVRGYDRGSALLFVQWERYDCSFELWIEHEPVPRRATATEVEHLWPIITDQLEVRMRPFDRWVVDAAPLQFPPADKVGPDDEWKRTLWPGMIGNGVIVSVAFMIAWYGSSSAFRAVRRWSRRRRGLCVWCAYPIAQIESERCPECGAEAPAR